MKAVVAVQEPETWEHKGVVHVRFENGLYVRVSPQEGGGLNLYTSGRWAQTGFFAGPQQTNITLSPSEKA